MQMKQHGRSLIIEVDKLPEIYPRTAKS